MNPSVNRSSKAVRPDWYTQKFITTMISQEDKVHQFPTMDGTMELIESYSKLIEVYSSKKDLMATYFTERMQKLLQEQATVDLLEKKQTKTIETVEARMHKKPPLESRMSYRSTKRKKHMDDIMEQTLRYYASSTHLITGELNVQRIDLQQRLKAVKLRQQDNIARMAKVRNKEIDKEANGII